MSVESLFEKVEEMGLRINNLFQLDGGLWQANLRSKDSYEYHEFGTGKTAVEALHLAVVAAKSNTPKAKQKSKSIKDLIG